MAILLWPMRCGPWRVGGGLRTQIALAWLLAQPDVTAPIVGATKIAHLEQAAAALDISVSASESAEIEAPYVPHPVLGID